MRRQTPNRAAVLAAAAIALVLGGIPAGAEEPAALVPDNATEVPVESALGEAPGPVLSGDSPDYVIEAADVVRIMVWRNPDLSAEVPVRPDGRISVPLLGDVEAAGLTTAALRDGIAAGLAEFITAPDVTVIVSQVNSKVVFLVGEVGRPSAVPLNRDMRVLYAISVAGGFSPYASRRKIKILRPQPDGSVQEIRFNYNRFVKGKDIGTNIPLQPGDTIVVP